MKTIRRISFLSVLFFNCFSILSQNSSPHIEGNVYVNMETGLFRCDVTISNLTSIEDYSILINKGMNVKHFLDNSGNSLMYDGSRIKGEAIQYVVGNSKGIMNLPTKIQIEYVGAFPKYSDSYNTFDFKGFIAINDKTIRATEQTKWYPVIYDVKRDKLINSYTYNLEIAVIGGKSIFINGSAPQKTIKGNFTSKKAVPLFLFAGDYDFVSEKGNYILNGGISKKTAAQVFKNVRIVQSFLEEKLDRTFEDNVYLIQHKAVNKRKEGSNWGFNTYPSFAFTGDNYFSSILTNEGTFSAGNFRYFGHEFGHNYFGNNVQSGKLFWFWLESIPEYLSFTFAEKMGGKKYLKQRIRDKIESVKNKKFIPLAKITEANQIDESYRYNMAPLLLMSFDLMFGRETTFKMLKNLLSYADSETLTLDHFKKAALKSGVPTHEYKNFEIQYLKNDDFRDIVISYLEKS